MEGLTACLPESGPSWCESGVVAHRLTSHPTCQFHGCEKTAAHELDCLLPTGDVTRDLLLCDEHEAECNDVGVLELTG